MSCVRLRVGAEICVCSTYVMYAGAFCTYATAVRLITSTSATSGGRSIARVIRASAECSPVRRAGSALPACQCVRMTAILPAEDVVARVVELRREIHRHPELGFEETRTQALVEAELKSIGVEHRRIAKTGVVGIIRGAKPGRTAGLRADMDALPITERSGEPFASEVAGKMHACGHDAHTAMLLGAARVLQNMRGDLHGTVVLLFQPAEEGPGGALPMIEAGVMDNPKIEAVMMLHVDNRIDAGTIGITPGAVNAAADEFHVTISGVGGHGAAPHRAVDTIPCAAATVLALQNIAAREVDPLATVVVTVGTINGGYRNNVIADSVKMTGTFRSQDTA